MPHLHPQPFMFEGNIQYSQYVFNHQDKIKLLQFVEIC